MHRKPLTMHDVFRSLHFRPVASRGLARVALRPRIDRDDSVSFGKSVNLPTPNICARAPSGNKNQSRTNLAGCDHPRRSAIPEIRNLKSYLPTSFFRREGGHDLLEARIAAERVPVGQQFQLSVTDATGDTRRCGKRFKSALLFTDPCINH